MSFEDNRDNVENIYDKMINNLSPELKDNQYYRYFYNILETGSNYCKFFNSRLIKTIEEEWVEAIEEALPALQKVVLNPRKFIDEEREVVNIAMARQISPESIQHLLQHSNMIDQVNEDGTVVPNRILNVYKEESLNTYENRFICTLILELQTFINRRFNVIFDNSKDERGTFFEMESFVDNYTETINYKLEIKIKDKESDIDNESENVNIFTRISKIHRQINDLASSGFMVTMKPFPLVRPPIVKTNAIAKNLNYKACYKLWNYIHSYDKVGYKIDMVKQEPMITKEFERDIYNSFLWDYFMLRNFLENTDALNVQQPKRPKEMGTRQIRQALDEIIRNTDMSDANLRKLIMTELADLQLKRRTEQMNAEAAEKNKNNTGAKGFRRRSKKKHQ